MDRLQAGKPETPIKIRITNVDSLWFQEQAREVEQYGYLIGQEGVIFSVVESGYVCSVHVYENNVLVNDVLMHVKELQEIK